MAEYTKSIPRDPNDPDETLQAVLDAILFYQEGDDEFIRYEIRPKTVVITFEAVN